jgi:hypothetical protein
MSDQPVQPIQLPLVTRCAGAMPSSDLLGGGSEPTIQIQLNTLVDRFTLCRRAYVPPEAY